MSEMKEIILTPRKFEDLSSLEYSLFTCPLVTWPNRECLVAEFRGECGVGCRSNEDATFMAAVVKAAAEAWHPKALILDFRRLRYEWGDQMTRPLGACGSFQPERLLLMSVFGEELIESDVSKIPKDYLVFPRACIVSELNRTGLTSLVEREMGINPDDLLYKTLDEALAAVDHQAQRLFKRPQ